jgi:hypothetical protein
MSDIVVPITSPVHLTNIEDIHAVDLHVKYCELVKAYEQLVCSPSWEHGLLGSSELQCCVSVSLLSLGSSGDEPFPPHFFCRILDIPCSCHSRRCETGMRTRSGMTSKCKQCEQS